MTVLFNFFCQSSMPMFSFFFFQAKDGIRDRTVTGVKTCALPILDPARVRRYGESPHADYRLTDVASRGMAISFTVAADQGPFGEIFTQMSVNGPVNHT